MASDTGMHAEEDKDEKRCNRVHDSNDDDDDCLTR